MTPKRKKVYKKNRRAEFPQKSRFVELGDSGRPIRKVYLKLNTIYYVHL